MSSKRFRFVSAIILFLLLIVAKRAGWFQPSVEDMAEMNSFANDPYDLTVHFDLIDGDYAMYYDGTVHGRGEKASREGQAVVYYMNAFFYQDCVTHMDGERCCKQWRECWASADFSSPLEMIRSWQELAVEEGIYLKRKVPMSDYITEQDSNYEGNVYRVVLPGVELDWQALCDVNLDKSFGGQERFQNIPRADITLLYGADDRRLKWIQIHHEDESSWLSGWIQIQPASDPVQIDLSDYDIREDGLLREEWEIRLPVT